jgi:hypothetical protein
MKECPECDALIERLVADDVSSAEWETLRRHAEVCEDCRRVLAVHRDLSRLGREVPQPTDAEFRVMRMNVLARAFRPGGRPGWRVFGRDAWGFLRAQPAGAFLALAVLVAAAGFAGRWSAGRPRVDRESLLATLETQAATTGGVAGYWDAPFTYSNVAARPLPGGRLGLSFDVSWHVEVMASRESALARDVLMHAILEPSPLGTRLKAMDLTEQVADARLKEAVIFALRHDPNLTVRLKALEVLSQCPFDFDVQNALLETLKGDASVQMRFAALETLAGRSVSADVLLRTIDEGGLESDPAVMQRAFEIAQRM